MSTMSTMTVAVEESVEPNASRFDASTVSVY